MLADATTPAEIPRALTSYPPMSDQGLAATLAARIEIEPFNAIAAGIFLLAILHTFGTARLAGLAHRVQHRRDQDARERGLPSRPSVTAEFLHFFGEVEVVFGLWTVVLVVAMTLYAGWEPAVALHQRRRSTTPSRSSSSSSWRSHRRGR